MVTTSPTRRTSRSPNRRRLICFCRLPGSRPRGRGSPPIPGNIRRRHNTGRRSLLPPGPRSPRSPDAGNPVYHRFSFLSPAHASSSRFIISPCQSRTFCPVLAAHVPEHVEVVLLAYYPFGAPRPSTRAAVFTSLTGFFFVPGHFSTFKYSIISID